MKKLTKGDVFEVSKGMQIYVYIPERFVYSNTPYSNKTTKTDVTVGKIMGIPSEEEYPNVDTLVNEIYEELIEKSCMGGVKIDKKKLKDSFIFPKSKKGLYDTAKLVGEYVVTNAGYSGGGTGHGPHDVYPDGWHVEAKKLKNGKFDEKGEEISFYQSGCFTAMNEDVPVVRKMKSNFV